jgi:putative transposase
MVATRRDVRILSSNHIPSIYASEPERQAAYQGLFESPIDEPALSEIREATNKGWVLGNERFRAEIESMLQRRTCPLPRGGDRHSKQVRQGRINRV